MSSDSRSRCVLDNRSVTGEAVKSAHQLSGNKHRETSLLLSADVTQLLYVWVSISRYEMDIWTRTFLKQQRPRALELPEPAASRGCSSSDLRAASSQSPTRSCSATDDRGQISCHRSNLHIWRSRVTVLTLHSISVESLSMTLCQSCSWPVTLWSSSWNMALSCSVTESNCRRLTLLSRADLSAFCRSGETTRCLGLEDAFRGWWW